MTIFAYKSRGVTAGTRVKVKWNPGGNRWSIINDEPGHYWRNKTVAHATTFGMTEVSFTGALHIHGVANPYPDNRIGKMSLEGTGPLETTTNVARFDSRGRVFTA